MERVPSQIDKYRILEQIGSGGMGVIYKAEHPTLGRPVVLKQLSFAGGEAAVERFRREARLMMAFRHDAIVDVYDHFRSGSSWFIVAEYVDGVSLDSLIRQRGALPSEAALLVTLECARALEYAHDRGVIHRDVKPSNILISRRGEVKLTDFGVAAARGEEASTTLTATGVTLGTIAYMAPEQIESAHDVDRRADIYSLGVMLYEMVTGKAPFAATFTPQTLAAIRRGKHRPVHRAAKVAPLVRRIVGRAMRPAPRRRFQDVGELLRLLERGLRFTDSASVQRALAAYLDGRRPEAVTRRLRAVAPAAAALAAAAAAAAGGYALYRQGIVHELLFAGTHGALTVAVEGDTVSQPSAFVVREGEEKPVAVAALRRTAGRWLSRRLYVAAGSYRVAVRADGLLAWHALVVPPRALQRREGAVVVVEAGGDLAGMSFPLALRLRVRDALSGADLSGAARGEVKIGDGWSPLSRETLARLATGASYVFRFEADGYYPAIQAVQVAPHEALLRLEAALAPIAGTLRLSTTLSGVGLRLDGSARYLSAGPSPTWQTLEPLDAVPRELSLAPGPHRLTAERRDLGSANIEVTITSGERVAVSVEAEGGRLALRRLP